MIKGITFDQPHYLFLLLLIPLLGVWYYYRFKKNNADVILSSSEGFERIGQSIRLVLYHGLYVLRLLAISLLIVILARPQSSLSRQDISIEGIDIVLTVDISGSMLSEDFKPNRIEAAKDVATEFIDGRPNDRIGLVIFSGEAFTLCPLTSDHAVLKNLFKDVKMGMIEDGTAIGDGLATAVNHLRNSQAVSKVIILLTDGVNNMGSLDPLSAAEIAKLYGVRIYTVGVGTNGMAPYPVQTPYGIQYQNIKVEIDEELLKKVAQLTDGQYFRATNNATLHQIYQKIDKMEKSKIDVTIFKRKKEEYAFLAIIALAMIAFEILLRNIYFRNIP